MEGVCPTYLKWLNWSKIDLSLTSAGWLPLFLLLDLRPAIPPFFLCKEGFGMCTMASVFRRLIILQVQMKRTAHKACLLISKAEANSGWLSDPSIDPDMKWKYFVRVTRTATPMRTRRTPRMMRTITQAGLNTIILEMNKSQDNLHWFHDFKMVNLFPVFVLNTHLVPAKHNHKLS